MSEMAKDAWIVGGIDCRGKGLQLRERRLRGDAVSDALPNSVEAALVRRNTARCAANVVAASEVETPASKNQNGRVVFEGLGEVAAVVEQSTVVHEADCENENSVGQHAVRKELALLTTKQ